VLVFSTLECWFGLRPWLPEYDAIDNGRGLKDDVYLAAGLSPVVTLIGILVYSPKKETGDQDWARIVLYVATPIFLAAPVTPGLKQDIKYFVRYGFFFCNACIIVDRKPR
jgi:hypothetical protein